MTHANVSRPTPQYARARRVAAMLDVSVATVWRWTKAGRLPAPHHLGPAVTAWNLAEVARHLAAAERDGHDGGPRAA